jgi:hypothetical protein
MKLEEGFLSKAVFKYKYSLILVITVIFSWVFLFYLEFFNYDNYVFSHFRIDLYRWFYLPGIILGVWFLLFLKFKKEKSLLITLGVLFCLVSVPVGIKSTGRVVAKGHQILLGQEFVVQKAKTTAFGNDYKFIEFVKNYLRGVDQTTLVVIPPDQLPWRHTGNTQIMNSFLYPIMTTNSIGMSKYVLISSEEDGAAYHLWPDFNIPAEKIIIYDWENDKAREISEEDWDPVDWQDQHPWGLIIGKDE